MARFGIFDDDDNSRRQQVHLTVEMGKEKTKIRMQVSPSDGHWTHLAPRKPIREAILNEGLFLSWVVDLETAQIEVKTATREFVKKNR